MIPYWYLLFTRILPRFPKLFFIMSASYLGEHTQPLPSRACWTYWRLNSWRALQSGLLRAFSFFVVYFSSLCCICSQPPRQICERALLIKDEVNWNTGVRFALYWWLVSEVEERFAIISAATRVLGAIKGLNYRRSTVLAHDIHEQLSRDALHCASWAFFSLVDLQVEYALIFIEVWCRTIQRRKWPNP